MKDAYDTSGKIFTAASRLYRPGLLEQLGAIKQEEIVVVRGQHDTVEELLGTLKVPYTMITPEEIPSHNGGRVMLVNCATYGANKKRDEAVGAFVSDGGRLVTTDWAIDLVINAFPGKLKRTKNTGDEVVEIETPTDLGRKFMGMNYAQCHPQWWLEGTSYVYDVKDPSVTAIITSEEMRERHGQPYVAVGFKEGSGEVFHFISHMKLQRSRQKNKEHAGTLDDFLEKMKISKTPDMDDATVADLEAAFSTLNTLAYLCLPAALLGDAEMKSTYGATILNSGSSASPTPSSGLGSKALKSKKLA